MRFRRLLLEAFGPFTREELDLSGGAPGGLHVIYGPNEAGKSTSLRAVEGLLFGIPERSEDAHLHPLKSLSVGATLERGFGPSREQLVITRRKRRKDSLVDAEGNPLPDDVLASWLGGLDQRTFFSRFGLDQTRLEQGAEALLGGSEEGLFAAGTGGPDVARLAASLRAEEEALYGVRAKRPLNRALVAVADAARAARQAARVPEKWREQKRAHEQALERVQALREERSRLKLEQARIHRLTAVRSDVARWVGATEELERLGPQPELPPDADVRRSEAQRAHRDAEREIARLGREIDELESALRALPEPSSLLQVEAERWENLEKKIGWEHKAREDRPKLEGKLAARLDELQRHLARLGQSTDASPLSRVDALAVEAAVERRAQRLSVRHAQLELAAREAERQLEELTRQHAVQTAATPQTSEDANLEDLEAALARARRALDRSGRQEALRADVARLEREAGRLRQELGLTASFEALREALPTVAEVRSARAEAESLTATILRLTESAREQRARYERAEAALAAQDLAGEVPSEARLAELRRERDALLEKLSELSDLADLRRSLDELGGHIAAADRAADRLRLEAHRLSEREKHLGARETARVELERCERELADAQGRLDALTTLWRGRWEGLGAKLLDVTHLGALHEGALRLTDVEMRLAQAREELDALDRDRTEAAAGLEACLGERGKASAPLEVLVERAGERLTRTRQEREQGRLAQSRLEELTVRLAQQRTVAVEAARQLEAWRAEWESVLEELRLPKSTPPDEVQAILAELTELGRVAEDARDKQRRLAGIDRDSRQFAEQVRALAERHAPQLVGSDALEAATELLVLVRAARDAEKDRSRLEAELAERQRALLDAERARDAAWGVLEELMQLAGVSDPVELGPVEQRVRRARELRAQRAQLEDVLRAKAAKGSLDELIAEARSVSALELSTQADELEARLEEVEEALRAAEYDASAKEAGLELYRSEDAAQAEQRLASATADARVTLREFLELRTARVLLEREMARYAERHQGPILARANEHFPRLTLGRYSGLRVGVGERTLRCVRDGKEIEVGELSRGTRAQLYLALRLASLEHYFAGRPAIPLVFDDLFVDFDDDRACAAFEILGELAERVQILYFTHLVRDLQAARDAVPPSHLFEHRIGVLQAIAQPA